MSRTYLFTIQPDHVGKCSVLARGKMYSMSSVMGRIIERDVGKQVFETNGVIQVENDEQRDRRLGRFESGSKRKGEQQPFLLTDFQRSRLHSLLWEHMRADREHPDRVVTGWGTKTWQGLVACIERIVNEKE